jgi:FkbM family methyltransferase
MITRPDFRQGTTDECVYDEVIRRNCYRVKQFSDKDVVIDVGAHLGYFSLLCAEHGAGKVIAFEIEPENIEIARKNCAQHPQIELHNKAVWKESGLKLGRSGMYMTADNSLKNTGSSHVVIAPGCHTSFGDLETITLDDILEPIEHVALVKMDCEGAEFEIVPNVKSWEKVDRLVGEVHGYRKEYHVPDFYMELKKHFNKISVRSYCPEFGLETFYCSK